MCCLTTPASSRGQQRRLHGAYRRARIEAANDTGLEKNEFPEECPYAWNDVVAREFTR
jgi:hypothetical protein